MQIETVLFFFLHPLFFPFFSTQLVEKVFQIFILSVGKHIGGQILSYPLEEMLMAVILWNTNIYTLWSSHPLLKGLY